MLYRLSYPCRYKDMILIFTEFSIPKLSDIYNLMLDIVYQSFKDLLEYDPRDYTLESLSLWATAIRRKGAHFTSKCFGFMDATCRFICRPCRDQRLEYSGHKKCHCIKVQSVATPDGITRMVYGPVPGAENDIGVLNDSNHENKLIERMKELGLEESDYYFIYADSGYLSSPVLHVPFASANLTPDQSRFNRTMSSLRITIEWSYLSISLYQALNKCL